MAEATERLLLQVDAATELLRRHLTEAEPSLDRFEKRAARMSENVDKSFGAMGQRVSAFGREAETAAQRAQQSFESSFTAVQKLAATAIKGPTADGRINLGADDIRAGAAAAQEQARAFGLIEDAARRAATAVRDDSEATRLFIAATAASRIEAEQKAAALLAEAGALERVEIELRQSGEAVDLFVGKHQRLATAAADADRLAASERAAKVELQGLAASANLLRAELDPMFAAQQRFNQALDTADALLRAKIITEREHAQAVALARQGLQAHADTIHGTAAAGNALVRSTGAQRAAMAGLSYQLQDVMIQASMGANILNVLAIQGGQAAGMFAAVEGKAGNFARFMIGPYGLAIQAALFVLTPLVSAVYDFATASDKAGAAAEVHREASERLQQAVDRLTSSQASANHATRLGIQADLDAAEAKRVHILRTRQLIDAQLEQAKGRLAAAQETQRNTGGTVPGAVGFGLEVAARQRISAIEGAQRINDAKRVEADRAIAAGRAQVVLRGVAAAADAATASTQKYEDAIDGLQRKFERGGFGNPNSAAAQRAFGAEAERVTRTRDREQNEIREANKKGPRGPSAVTLARRAEAARQKVLADDRTFDADELRARRRLIDAKTKSAVSEEEREKLLRDEIEEEAAAEKRRVANMFSAKKYDAGEAARLTDLAEQSRKQRLQNLAADRATKTIERRYDAEQGDLGARLALLRIGQDMAGTERERRTVARQILEAEQLLRRKALERIRDTSQDPNAVADARTALGRLPALETAENRQADQRHAGPIEQYRDRLRAATDDMGSAVEDAAVRGFGALEDAGSRATASAVTDLLHLKGVAGDVVGGVIADLARLAIQKAVVGAIGGGLFGFTDGGSLGDLPGFASGGSPGGRISGPGTGRSDSVLALLRGPGGKAVRLSNREFIMNEGAVDFYGPNLMAALNARQLPRFASGGALAAPRAPTLRSPRLPASLSGGARRDRMEVDVRVKTEPSPMFEQTVEATTLRTVGAAAEPIMAGSVARTLNRLRRPELPGGF